VIAAVASDRKEALALVALVWRAIPGASLGFRGASEGARGSARWRACDTGPPGLSAQRDRVQPRGAAPSV